MKAKFRCGCGCEIETTLYAHFRPVLGYAYKEQGRETFSNDNAQIWSDDLKRWIPFAGVKK